MWQTRKMEVIFKLKDKNTHHLHVIYKGEYICGQTYSCETARNLKVWVNEYSDVNKQSEPAKHISKHPNHKFTREVFTTAHSWLKRRMKEAFYIARFRPELNKHVQSLDLTMGTDITSTSFGKMRDPGNEVDITCLSGITWASGTLSVCRQWSNRSKMFRSQILTAFTLKFYFLLSSAKCI